MKSITFTHTRKTVCTVFFFARFGRANQASTGMGSVAAATCPAQATSNNIVAARVTESQHDLRYRARKITHK